MDSWVWKIRWRRDRLSTLVFLGFPCGSAGKESTCNVGDLGLIPELGRSPGEGKVYPLQYSGLENSMDCSPWGHKESDRTERLSLHFTSLHLSVAGPSSVHGAARVGYSGCHGHLNCKLAPWVCLIQVPLLNNT